MVRPRVSVVVPVRDRRDLLPQLLEALVSQTETDFEAMLIDDGSTDGSGDIARRIAAADSRFVVLDGGGRGAVRARRLGVMKARADVLAFTDSDCVPAPDWLERGAAHVESGADVVQGRTEPTREVAPLERTVWVTEEDGLYATCNVFYRREAYDDAGGFDIAAGERWGFRPGRALRDLGFGEDTLLGWRVRRRGVSRFAPDVLVRHHVFDPEPAAALARACNAGGFAALVREVPELRSVFLQHRILLGSASRVPLYLAGVLELSGRRRLAGLATAAWVAGHAVNVRGIEGWSRRVVVLAVELGIDLVTAASLVAGSAKARRIVL